MSVTRILIHGWFRWLSVGGSCPGEYQISSAMGVVLSFLITWGEGQVT